MPAKTTKRKTAPRPIEDQVAAALAWLKRKSSKAVRDGMARYAIPSDNALGVSVADIRVLGKEICHNQDLAEALWHTGIYEARMLASFVADPKRVTPALMDRWCKDFDNWAICDTLCFHLFDRTPHAFAKVKKWSGLRDEFGKRAAFALLASLALHDKKAADENFIEGLALIERAAGDERNFVKKGVSWALCGIGARRSPALKTAAVATARRLADSTDPTARWIGKDALSKLAKRANRP